MKLIKEVEMKYWQLKCVGLATAIPVAMALWVMLQQKESSLLKFNKFIDLLLKILFPLSKPCSTGTKLWFRLVSLWNFKVSCHRPWDNLVWIVTSLWLQQCTRCDYVQNIFLVICGRRYKWTGSIKNRYLYINKNVSDVNSHGGMGAEICTVWPSGPGLCSLPSQVIQGLIS